ncbi:hypothetical protein ACJDT4_13990 [Clostridium neuense]|uniref:Tripartite tricarboxylate transporter TctB family protein n=1 Tax=Clostridium neuense TaxID=1728934 RepID=A0ABW8TJ69_9CLOT
MENMKAGDFVNVQPVSPEVASSKLVTVVMMLYNFLTPIIYPIALLGYAAAFIFLIGGALLHSKTIKKMAAADFGVITLALVFYYFMPVFIGLLKSLTNVVK